ELRDYLKEKFEYIEIFAFNDLIFEEIEQDVVILVCAKRHKKQGVAFFQVEHLEDLKEPLYVQKNSNVHRKTLDKWTNYVLSDADLKFLDAIRAKLRPIKDYCRAEVGIVTAANDYFIVDRGTVRDYHLEAIARPIIKKGSHIQSTLYMREADYLQGIENGVPGYFLEFPDSEVSMPASYESYLQEGVRRGLTERYKMKLRKKWYIIPSLWVPEGFFTKRSNIFPRMMVNEARLMVTDSFYRILMKEGYRIEDLTFSFYNSLTMIFAELEGRFYGGSVLELTPSEYKNLIVPYHPRVPKRHLAKLDELLKKGAGVEEIMAYTDKILLCDHFGLNEEDAERLKRIYKKLLLRRLKGKKYTKA
ncbi:MAG TPA: hypothetical protein VFT59_00590, partial [Candidatus Saccharimonadales bacterium]|nr:hypothetical protein [Candidatus Saccharimonadales bacterium]